MFDWNENITLFSPLGKLARILRAEFLPMFFLYFYIIFLMIDVLDPVSQNLINRSSPKFHVGV